MVVSFPSLQLKNNIFSGNYKDDKERVIETETEGDSVVKALFYFLLEYKNSVDCFQLDTMLTPNVSLGFLPCMISNAKWEFFQLLYFT